MANKWQLNEAKQIAYFDANGNRQFAKEVWYIGKYRNYQIWPGDIYLKDVYITDDLNNPKKYNYVVDEQGEPIYIDANGNEWTGLSVNNPVYYVTGTIVVAKLNSENEEYENCYLEYIGTLKSYNGTVDGSPIWKSGKSENTKFNEMLEDNAPYGWFQCSNKGLYYLGENENNAYVIPQLAYRSLRGDPTDYYYLNFGRLGEEHDPGAIKLKRAPITRQFVFDNSALSHPILGKNEFVESDFVYETKDTGPSETTDLTKNMSYFSITNNNPDIFDVTLSNGHLKLQVTNPKAGENTYSWSINSSIFGYEDSHTFSVTTLGVRYVVLIGNTSIESDSTNAFEISEKSMVSVKKATTLEEMNKDHSEWADVDFSLTVKSGSTSIIGVSGVYLNPYQTGTATVTVTDNETGDSFDFMCNVEVNEDTYVEINVNTTSGSSTVLQRCLLNNNTRYATIPSDAMGISISFYSGETGDLQKSVYYKADQTISGWNGMSTSWPYSPSSTISLGGRTISAGTSTFTISSTNNDDGIIGKLQLTFNT